VFANKFKVSNYFEEQDKPLKEKESQVSSVVDPMAESILYAQSRFFAMYASGGFAEYATEKTSGT